MDGAACPFTDETKKRIKDFISSSFYSQTRRYNYSHVFGYKQAYINFILIGHQFCCVKR